MRDQGGAQVPRRHRASRALSPDLLHRLVPRPHAGDAGSRRQREISRGFGPPVAGFDHVAFGNLNEMRAAIDAETAGDRRRAGAGRRRPRHRDAGISRGPARHRATSSAFCWCSTRCRCGMGRTGQLFAHQWTGITPDVMALAKALGRRLSRGRLPCHRARRGRHDAGHARLDLRRQSAGDGGANAVLDVMLEPGFFAARRARSPSACARGSTGWSPTYPKVFAEVRGKGLLIGLRCAVPNSEMVDALRAAGLLVVGRGRQRGAPAAAAHHRGQPSRAKRVGILDARGAGRGSS